MGRRPRMKQPIPLAELARTELMALGLGDRLLESEIWRIWPEIVGSAIAGRARPLRIINGVLTVAVSSGPWKQELTFLKGVMLEKLNSCLGKTVIREIILKSGSVNKLLSEEPDMEAAPKKKRLTARQSSMIDEQSADLVDPEIQESFRCLMKASMTTSRKP